MVERQVDDTIWRYDDAKWSQITGTLPQGSVTIELASETSSDARRIIEFAWKLQ